MKAAMILSGCGVFDGSEIHEATILLLVLAQMGYQVDFFSLNQEMDEAISHITQRPLHLAMNIMEMSARIARGEISDMQKLQAQDYDLLAVPGGYGVATNFSNFAKLGVHCMVDPQVARVIEEFFEKKRWIVGMCIAPMILAKVLNQKSVKMTVGDQENDLKQLSALGVQAVKCSANQGCLDEINRIYTAPGYLANKSNPATIYQSLQKLREVLP